MTAVHVVRSEHQQLIHWGVLRRDHITQVASSLDGVIDLGEQRNRVVEQP